MPIHKADLDHFFDVARMDLIGSSENGLRLELFEVLKEFSEDSNAWWEDLQINPLVGVQDYPLAALESPSQIIRLLGVWNSDFGSIAAVMPTLGTLHLRHVPSSIQATPWYARVILTVAFPANKDDIPTFPGKLFRQYSVTLMDGMLGKMMSHPNMPYSNQQSSLYHLRRFRTGIQQAKTAAHRQNLMGAQSWHFPRGWSSHSQRGGLTTRVGGW